MTDYRDPKYLLNQQYGTSSKLNARIVLHQRFSTNPYGWFAWVFDQFKLLEQGKGLEIGGGTGELWRSNLGRIPRGWEITVTDFSEGMVNQARQNLDELPNFDFRVMDAQSIPYPDAYFDAVIANHMLYHVPDRPKALAEMRRVLKPGGQFYATTIGANHMQDINALATGYHPALVIDTRAVSSPFHLENGAEQIAPFFSSVEVRRYQDALHITEAAPLTDYILSSMQIENAEQYRAGLQAYLEETLERRGGAIDILKESVMFIAA